jgi:hypothetical protein
MASAPVAPSARALVRSTSVALVAAGVILVSFVLPAEYGVDPVGIGGALGLTGMSGAERSTSSQGGQGPVFSQSAGYREDAREFKLGPYEYIEFKYELATGASMLYQWKASAPVTFNLHTDPAGKPKEASESFEKGDAAGKQGAYVSPYPGLHGWYWENPGGQEVTVQLSAVGFFKSAKEFHFDGTTQTYEIQGLSLPPSK